MIALKFTVTDCAEQKMTKENTMKLKTALAIILLAGIAGADIIMTVDTTSETFSFSGSVSLVNDDMPTWSNVPGLTIPPDQITCASAFSYAGPGMTMGDPRLQVGPSQLRVIPEWYSEGASGITGTGTSYSYSSLSSDSKTYLAGLNGTIFSDQNSGASQLQVTVVPEPATAGMLLLSSFVLFGFRRLKKAMNYYRS